MWLSSSQLSMFMGFAVRRSVVLKTSLHFVDMGVVLCGLV